MRRKSPKRSPIWQISSEDLKLLVEQSKTLVEVIAYFGLTNPGNNKTLKARFVQEGINFDKFKYQRKFDKKLIPLEDVLVENSTYCRQSLKKRLIKEGLLENKCSECGLGNEWNGKPITLEIDHINGVSNDNRLINLRILCPNCHSQASTSNGRNNINKKEKKKYYCQKCGSQVWKTSSICVSCSNLAQRTVDRPDRETLLKLIDEKGFVGVGREYGVSDNAIRKWLKVT